jgi:hypothetical protein
MIKQLKEGKIYFGSWFWRPQSIGGRNIILAGGCSRAKQLTFGQPGSRESEEGSGYKLAPTSSQ